MLIRTIALLILLFANPLQVQASNLLLPGDVIKGHAKEEQDCEKCHKKFDKGAQPRLCMDCHKDIGKDVAGKSGFHGRLDAAKECKECHTEHKGRDAKIAEFDHAKFDHKQTDFVLKGAHLGEKVKCTSCHKPDKKFSQAPTYCNDCHKKDDKHKGGLGTDCAKCHIDKDWKTTEFDHDKTHFKLLGKHVDVKCVKCHIEHKYKDTPKTCVACHKQDDVKAHKGKLGTDCAKCHSEKDWKTTKFDHDKTEFKLLGKHEEVKCDKCHIDKKYKGTPKLCNACHKKDDDKAHKGKFGPKCETCHTEKDWKEITFDHEKKTKFPLLGKHRAPLKCTSCHKGDLYKDKLEMTCIACHKKDDDKSHKGKFGTKCETCHDENDWKKSVFDHDKKTKFPLLGKHKSPAPLKCTACHKGDLVKDKLPMDCFSCHEKDDKHKGQEGKKCETCHGAESWNKTTFDHQRMSKYPLLGRHFLVACKKCHLTPLFKDAPKECMGCHEKDDVHKRRLGTECQVCHSTRSWETWDFDHNKTDFKLDGPHKKSANKCYSCHSKPMDKKVVLSSSCGSCHDRDDVHNGNFGDRCDRCHDGNTWKDIKLGVVVAGKETGKVVVKKK